VILSHLDDLVISGRITGYTVEEDTQYLRSERPTLTYRMYTTGAKSHLNLGAFAAAMADLGSSIRLSRLDGVVGNAGHIIRSRQICLTAEFAWKESLLRALRVVRHRFTAAPAAAPGSWRYPDVRVTGVATSSTATAYAHQWPHGPASVVALTLDPAPPVKGAGSYPVQVLRSWLGLLGGPTESASDISRRSWFELSA
jgi:hypothetical protein